MKSLNCLARRGFLVLCGNSSGKVDPIDPLLLSQKGSLTLTRPTLGDFVSTSEEMLERSTELFKYIQDGIIKLHINAVFPLKDAAKAHIMMEERKTSGKIILIP